MYTRQLRPKLGALQRWVRECDATSTPDGEPGDAGALRCLDMILRIANAPGGGSKGRAEGGEGIIREKAVWVAREEVEEEIGIWDKMQDGSLVGE